MIVKVTIFLTIFTVIYGIFEDIYLESNPSLLIRIYLGIEHPWWHLLLGVLVILDLILIPISAFYLLFL